jgi:flagellar assembly factor FliW
LKIETGQFGSLEIEDEKIIAMPHGMPGFPGANRFVILDREETRPFYWYQCVDDPDLALVVMNPYLFKADYRVDLEAVQREMGWENNGDGNLRLYVVVNASEGVPEKITANLIGPLVINTKRREAVQMVISSSPYSHRYPVFDRGASDPTA